MGDPIDDPDYATDPRRDQDPQPNLHTATMLEFQGDAAFEAYKKFMHKHLYPSIDDLNVQVANFPMSVELSVNPDNGALILPDGSEVLIELVFHRERND